MDPGRWAFASVEKTLPGSRDLVEHSNISRDSIVDGARKDRDPLNLGKVFINLN